MSGLNKAIVIGHVGKDPEIRATQDGRRVANFSVATSEAWTDKRSGERRERTEWHRIAVFNDNIINVVEKYVKKGSLICVIGSMRTRKWTDQQGVGRYTTEIHVEAFNGELRLLGSKSSRPDDAATGPSVPSGERPVTSKPDDVNDLDDEVLF